MRKDLLAKRHKRLLEKREALKAKALASQDVNEVRSINEQLEELNEEISEVAEEISAIESEEAERAAAQQGEQRSAPPAGAQKVNGGITASFSAGANNSQQRENSDPFSTMEYRQAFMKYAQTGAAIPVNLYQRRFRAGRKGKEGA